MTFLRWYDETNCKNLQCIKKLPPVLIAKKIFSKLGSIERQQVRGVCQEWKSLIDKYYGIKVKVTDENWKWIRSSKRVVSAKMSNLVRRSDSTLRMQIPLARSLVSLEISGETTFNFLLPILKQCYNLQTLTIDIYSSLPSTLTRNLGFGPFEGKLLLPNLQRCNLVCLQQTPQDSGSSLEHLQFMGFIFNILQHTPVKHLDFTANRRSQWWLPFHALFHMQIPYTNIFCQDMDLSHVQFLPVQQLLGSLQSLTFCNDYELNFSAYQEALHYSYNSYSWIRPGLTLKRVDFKVGSGKMWPAKGWHNILMTQTNLRELSYEIHYESEMRKRVLSILNNNKGTLKVLKLHGTSLSCHGMDSFDGSWFHKLVNLTHLELIGERSIENKIHLKRTLPMLTRPWNLPSSLQTLVVHGYIDCGRVSPGEALEDLINLQTLEVMGRYCNPWFVSNWNPIYEIDSCFIANLADSIVNLEYLKLLWIKRDSLQLMKMKPKVTTFHLKQEQARVSHDIINELDSINGRKVKVKMSEWNNTGMLCTKIIIC